jgi:copper(I)-binding protein
MGSSAYATDIQIDDAWAFATSSGKETANVYMYITSKQAVALVEASCKKSKSVELRTMLHKAGMMQTIQVQSIDLQADSRTDMTSEHGYHLTLVGLNSPLEVGKTVPLTLKFKQANQIISVDVKVKVRPARGAR